MTDRHSPRLCVVLWLTGLAGALSLLVAPLERLQPAGLDLEWWQFRLIALINPVILLTAAVAIGCWASRRVGLTAPLISALLERGAAGPVLRRQFWPAVVGGIITALVLWIYSVVTAPIFATAPNMPEIAMPLITKLLYGGVVEELLLRWGVMSLLVWLAWKVSRRDQPGPPAYWTGVLLAALLFAAGHLPLLHAIMPQPSAALLLAVLTGNALPGLIFGWLFWQRGLEAAMMAHALGHLLFVITQAG